MAPVPERTKRGIALFERRFADWLQLRAELQHASLAATVDMDAIDAKVVELDAAAALLMTTPAPVPWIVWKKFEVLEQIVNAEEAGRGDRAEVWMLAGIKADLLAFGIGGDRT